jgi:hypothetical protein
MDTFQKTRRTRLQETRMEAMNPCEIISAIRDEYPDLTRWGFWEPTQDGFETARDEMTSDHAIAEFAPPHS